MAPLHPVLSDAKDSWEALQNIMDWFSKIVTTGYEYSDAVADMRQGAVNKEYQRKKAEKKAKQIQLDQLSDMSGEGEGKVKRNIIWKEW